MKTKEIYLAAGCFWGTEAFMRKIKGIIDVKVGYANGKTLDTSYEQLYLTDHAETAKIIYNSEEINLTTILAYYFKIIDPVSINKQGNDVGRQYRTGIFYTDENDLKIINAYIDSVRKNYDKPIAVVVEKLDNFILAEEYHQQYLNKNPGGYCHINLNLADEKIDLPEITEQKKYEKKSERELRERLTDLQYEVTQEAHTEPPFRNEFWNFFGKGLYVDITTGEPLFTSEDKFPSSCGWPAFSKAINKDAVNYTEDHSFGMERTEVKSGIGMSHLGHVFEDGPKETGGLRYCINSAALKFIPFEDMEKEGYGELKELFKEK